MEIYIISPAYSQLSYYCASINIFYFKTPVFEHPFGTNASGKYTAHIF